MCDYDRTKQKTPKELLPRGFLLLLLAPFILAKVGKANLVDFFMSLPTLAIVPLPYHNYFYCVNRFLLHVTFYFINPKTMASGPRWLTLLVPTSYTGNTLEAASIHLRAT